MMPIRIQTAILFMACALVLSCSGTEGEDEVCCDTPIVTPTPPPAVTIDCDAANTLSTVGVDCTYPAPDYGVYTETIVGNLRNINTNTVPNHIYGDFRERFGPISRTFSMTASPSIAADITSILNTNSRPRYFFGVAINGVLFAPAPATPFIFENQNTGEYNWDWVFEASMNKGPENNQVKLDCANAHSGDQGYHYHGNMFAFAEVLQEGLSAGVVPEEPVQVGWAADGFPIVYLYGPDANGNLVKLNPSYQLKSGDRPGDGVSAPCGPYNGKYYNDYEYVANLGDLDACNGIERRISLNTPSGIQEFPYFYLITETFPQIGRCFVGTPDASFR